MSTFFKARRLLIDTCVWLVYYLGDDAAKQDSVAMMFGACKRRGIELLYAPSTLKDVFYLVPRRLRRKLASEGETASEDSYRAVAWGCVRQMMDLATASPQSMAECELAWMLRNTHGDLEDNLIIASAETCNADYIVTYEKRLLGHYGPACATPEQVVGLLGALEA